MIDLSTRTENGISVIDIQGKLNTADSPSVEEYLSEIIDGGVMKIIVNLKNVDYISSTGLRVILVAGKKLAKSGGKLAMCSPNLTVLDVLKISGFNRMFKVFKDEKDALSKLS